MAAPPSLLRHIITLDAAFSHFLHNLFHPFLPAFLLLLLEFSADFRLFFPISLALLISPPLLPFLSPLLIGLLLDLVLVCLIKLVFRRSRPPYNPNMSAVVSADNFSFPSGHASRVFFVAALVLLSAEEIAGALVELKASGGWVDQLIEGDEQEVAGMVAVVVGSWAVMTAMSRVFLGRHFFLDVLAGASLGVIEGLIAFRFLRFEKLLSKLFYQKLGRVRS